MDLELPPDNLAQAPVVMVADAGQAKKPIATMRTVGICEPMENLPNDPVFNRETIDFQGAAVNYLFKYEKINLAKHGAKITLFQPPAHGQLSEIGNGAASYK